MDNFSLNQFNHFFFIGVAGSGMSAIAQYLAGSGKIVSGSDREFSKDSSITIRHQLQNQGITCFMQDGSGITEKTDVVVISTAIEESNIEFQKAKQLNIPIIKRSELLSAISLSKKTIAIAGTSGKSTTTGMVFHILQTCGYSPSMMTGAGLISLQKQGLIGNAFVGKGEYLVIEADESDGSLVSYQPEIGIILNIDKDHKELDELESIFGIFKQNIKDKLIVNGNHPLARKYSIGKAFEFGTIAGAGYLAEDFKQEGFCISFKINTIDFKVPSIGKYNMENAVAAVSIANLTGISIEDCATALKSYPGIYRRQQIIGTKNGITLIDDFAHNPVKIRCAIEACQNLSKRVIAWFQPHGYGPTKFLRNEFVSEISHVLRDEDEIIMSEIYYAGGTVTKDISSADLIDTIQKNNKKALFIEDRNELPNYLKMIAKEGDIILLMGARDPSLENFAKLVFDKI